MISERALQALGAAICALCVALGACAMHAALAPVDQRRLAIAALFGFAHGLALAALATQARTRWRRLALLALLIGTILFSGSLVLAAFFGIAPVFAPFGGSLLIAGWMAFAAANFRKSSNPLS